MDALRNGEAAVLDEPKKAGSDDESTAHGALNNMLQRQHEKMFHSSNRLATSSEEEPGDSIAQAPTPYKRGKQKCRKCGQLRAGHTCPFKETKTSSDLAAV